MSKPASKKSAAADSRFAPILLGGLILALAGFLIGSGNSGKRSDAITADLTALKAELAGLRASVEVSASGLRSEIEAQTKAHTDALKAEKVRIDQLATEITAVKKSLASSEAERIALAKDRDAHQAELQKARSEIEAARRKLEQVVGALSGLGAAKP